MKATTEDWTLAAQRSARWRIAEQRAAVGDMNCQCLLDLRRALEAMEQRAAAPAPEPAPAPAADPPLWKQMATTYVETLEHPEDWAAVLDLVANWLLADHLAHATAASRLQAEARRAREEA